MWIFYFKLGGVKVDFAGSLEIDFTVSKGLRKDNREGLKPRAWRGPERGNSLSSHRTTGLHEFFDGAQLWLLMIQRTDQYNYKDPRLDVILICFDNYLLKLTHVVALGLFASFQ